MSTELPARIRTYDAPAGTEPWQGRRLAALRARLIIRASRGSRRPAWPQGRRLRAGILLIAEDLGEYPRQFVWLLSAADRADQAARFRVVPDLRV